MRIKIYRYTIPCQTGVIVRKYPLTERQGFILKLEQDGKVGLGEVAPLPSFSDETLVECEDQLCLWANNPHGKLGTLYPSVAFGISCALAELNMELNSEGDFRSAILCNGDIATFSEKLTACNASYSSLLGKIKIGFNGVKEGKLAHQLLTELPRLQLRLDANRTWSLSQAVEFAEQVAKPLRNRIQFIEEPCQTPEQSRQFARLTGINIAWDETVREPYFEVKAEPNLTAIIIKPMLTGSLTKCVSLIKQAHQLGIQAIISSSIESSLGLTQLARIAKQYTPESVAGLDTLNLMKKQLIRTWQGSQLPLLKESDLEVIYPK